MIHETHVPCGVAGSRALTLEYFYREEFAEHPKPVVAVIPGGGWRHGGMKSVHNPHDWDPYLSEGMMVAGIRYRPVTEEPFPACLNDVFTALGWLRANADNLGIRRNALFVDGGSAGAHLATLAAALETAKKQQYPVKGVVLRAGPVDIARWYRDTYSNELLRDCTHKLLGGSPEEKPSLCREASPLSHIVQGMPPFLIFHGEQDEAVPLSQSEALEAALRKVGVSVRRIVVKNANHGLAPIDERGSSPNLQEIFQMKVVFFQKLM